MGHVFISYAHTPEDSRLASCLEEWLERAGVRTWRDKSQLPAGELLDDAIAKAIAECGAAIFLVSGTWRDRDWTNQEIQLIAGRDPGGKEIPRVGILRAAGVQPPAALSRFPKMEWFDDAGGEDRKSVV